MIIDGKKIANEILDSIKIQVQQLSFQPVFCDVLVGEDSSSAQYVRMKGRTAERVGMKFRNADYPSTITTLELVKEIKKISKELNICGLIVQLPLPVSINKQEVLDAIDPMIDVDSTGKINSDLFYSGRPYVTFPTAAAIIELLKSTGKDLKGKNILVMGFGQLVGRPVSYLLEQQGLNVKVVRSTTPNADVLMREADVIVSAVGKPKLIDGSKIKPGAIVVDAGTSESDSGGIAGDVDFATVKDVAGFVSPVPGGVGPVTVAKLLENVLKVAKTKK